MLGKITSLLAAFETVSGLNITRQMIGKLLLLVALTIAAAITASALFLLCLYGIYLFLTSQGLSEAQSLVIIGLLMIVKLACIITLLLRKLRRMQSIPLHVSSLGAQGVSTVQSILRGFYHGVTGK